MRFFAYLAAVAVLFAIANRSAAQAADPVAPPSASAKAAGLRMLTWPGKVAIAAPAKPVAPRAPAVIAPQPQAAALPTSIYSAPPARPATAPVPAPRTQALALAQPQAADGGATPRFYSLHRAYGQKPDAIALTPQFFASDSPDLARPPPPAARPVVTASGRVERAAPVDSDPAN